MSEIQDRCVLLKNLPHTLGECDIKETLDLAHGDFRFQDKYEKIHRHIEFGNDVRWIVLFKSKKDATNCITGGTWVSDVVRGGCTVIPDYCSGCIVPDKWSESTSEEEEGEEEEWDLVKSGFRTRDCGIDTSEDFMSSFVNVSKNLKHDESESENGNEDQGATDVSFSSHQRPEKPVPAKRVTVMRKSDRHNETGTDTVRFENKFESLIVEIEDDSSDQSFDSRNDKEEMNADKDNSDLPMEKSQRTIRSSGSTYLSEERISSSELYGSGSIQPDAKEYDDITTNKAAERNIRSESEVISSDELFGSGNVNPEKKEKKDITISRPKENFDTTVSKRSLPMDKDRDNTPSELFKKKEDIRMESSTKDKSSAGSLEISQRKLKPKLEYGGNVYDDNRSSSLSSGDLFHSGDKKENTRFQHSGNMIDSNYEIENKFDAKHKENVFIRTTYLFGSGRESIEPDLVEDTNVDNLAKKKGVNIETEAKVTSTTNDKISSEKFEISKRKLKPKSEHGRNDDDRANSSSSGDCLFHSGDKEENAISQNTDDMIDSNDKSVSRFDFEHRKSASIKSADLFGVGSKSIEFENAKEQALSENTNVEQITKDKGANAETEANKSKTSEEEAVKTSIPDSYSGEGVTSPIYQGVPYPFPMMYPNHQGGSNVPYAYMMAQGQSQPNVTTPGNPSQCAPNYTNAMYQMPYQWPMQMPVQGKENGPYMYPYTPYPVMMPPMQFDDKGRPLQNYPAMMMQQGYGMQYFPGQPPSTTQTSQQSADDKAETEEHSYISFNTELSEVESKIKSTELSKSSTHDRVKTSKGTNDDVYDVPKPPHRVLTRQTSASKSPRTPESTNTYSYARESKSEIVPDINDAEENIYDEIDESRLKSIVNEFTPEPPLSRPPSKIRAREDTNGKERRVPVYVNNEYFDDRTETNENLAEGNEDSCRTILVTGLSPDISRDAIELYFENKKKTGGGEIVSATICEKKMEAIIEFKDIEDATEVIRRALSGVSFTLYGIELHVSEYQPPPMDRCKVFITGIADTTTIECITNFIAAQLRSEPLSVIRGETPGTALVSFERPPDINNLRKVCEKRKCEGKHWNISEVELVRSIKVEGLNSQISTDALSLYFENKRRSQGGEVESVKFREYNEDYIVTFKYSKDAERVCQAEHTVDGKAITVSLFYPCLELDEDFVIKIPQPIEVDDQDIYIVKFFMNSKQYQQRLESKISQCYGEIIWPPTDRISERNIQVRCTIDEKDVNGFAKVKNWKETCLAIIREFTDGLTVERSRNVAVEVWSDLNSRLREIKVPHPECIAVFLESSDCKVVMVGEKQQVQNMSFQLQAIINDIEKKIDSESQTVTKKRNLMVYELALFRASKLEGTLKKMIEQLEVDNNQREVIFKGKQKDVDSAMEKLDKKLKSFVKKQVPGVSRQAINLLFKREARDQVKKKMIERKIIGVWDVKRGTTLVMYSRNENDLDIAIEILLSTIIMDSISLDENKRNILSSSEGNTKVAEFENNYQDCIHFEIVPTAIRFVCVSNIHQEIKDEFTKLFDLHSVISKFIETEPGTFSYIMTYKKLDIRSIEIQYSRLAVEIEVKDSRRRPGFNVKGKKDGCKLAIDKLQTLIDSVVREDHTVSWPGFDTFIQSSEGKSSINAIEVSKKCVIKVSADVLSSGLESTIHRDTMSTKANENAVRGGRIAKVVKIGSLASEQVDVIVNSTNSNLDMNVGAISRTLLKAGGDIIERECKERYRDGIKPGEVGVTTGGALYCNELYHGVLVKWDYGQGLAERVMVNFIKCCLSLASTSRYTSISFPALGTGAMGFPADIVASTMFETVDAFEAKHPDTSLRQVRFVVWSGDKATTKAFEDMESKTAFQRSSGVRQSYRQSEAAENLIVKNKGYSSTIGPVSVSIVKDDLTTFTSGAIVNSTMDDLNLNSGAISRAIVAAAGSTIQSEALQNRTQFLKEGFVVTSPGRLLCKNIIHIKARNSLAGWADSIKKCLKETERLGLNSVAFPALGTGGKGIQADRMAKTMIDTFQDYIKSYEFQRCLKTIRIVIFEQRMLDTFILEAKAELDTEKTAKRKSLLQDLKFWEKKAPEAAEAPKVTMHIYCESKHSMSSVVSRIKEIRQEKEAFVPRVFLEQMDERLKSDLRRIGSSLGVKVVIDKSRVLVMGYGKSVRYATTKLEEYTDKIAKEKKKENDASSVKLPVVWSKMKLSDATRIERLRSSAADYATVSQRFINETGYQPSCIVKIERIQNPALFMQYAGKKKQMEQLNSGGKKIEQVLWHGTRSTAVDNITSMGFDRNYNSGASHGVGVYFAVKASTSAGGYCSPDATGNKHIFLAHVLTGDYCVGRGGIRVPPLKATSPATTYDSTTDNVQNPNFFVIFHDSQAYPSYLITFK